MNRVSLDCILFYFSSRHVFKLHDLIKVDKYYKFLVLSIFRFKNKNLRQIFLNMISSSNNIYIKVKLHQYQNGKH
jgi:hypothetical protein